MIYDLSKNNPYDRDKFMARVKELLAKGERGVVAVNLSEKKPQRSTSQNNYLHLILGFFGAQMGYTLDEVKVSLFKRLVNPELFVRVKTNKMGMQVQYLRSTSDLDSTEMTTAIERFRNFSSSRCGVYLPSPEEKQFLLHCEKELEANKEFM